MDENWKWQSIISAYISHRVVSIREDEIQPNGSIQTSMWKGELPIPREDGLTIPKRRLSIFILNAN